MSCGAPGPSPACWGSGLSHRRKAPGTLSAPALYCPIRRSLTGGTPSPGVKMDERLRREGLTFDDVLLLPAQSSVLPTQVSTVTLFSRNISLNTPIVSAAMDTV